MTVHTKNVKLTAKLMVEFSQFYRENRHGTRIIKVKINADFVRKDKKYGEFSCETRVKVPKEKREIVWDIPENCPEWIKDELCSVYDYEYFTKLLSTMKKRRACM